MSSRHLNMQLRSSPHVAKGVGVEEIMRTVTLSLVPITLAAVYTFGISVLALVASCLAGSLITEHLICRVQKRPTTLRDYSATITGVLLALCLPPGFPLWMGFVGGVVSIALGKSLCGGLGFNVFNPALVGRAFLQAAFPSAITTWQEPLASWRFTAFNPSSFTLPFLTPINQWASGEPSAFTGATPLAAMKWGQQVTALPDLFFGVTAGSTGEGAALVILLCGAYLAYRKMLDLRIPVAIFLAVTVFSGAFWLYDPASYPEPLFMLFSGGLMIGAVYMATDMVTSPVTPAGSWAYGILIGFLIVIIRLFGGLPEGVMYAILLGNAVVPLLNHITQPRVYGSRSNKDGAAR